MPRDAKPLIYRCWNAIDGKFCWTVTPMPRSPWTGAPLYGAILLWNLASHWCHDQNKKETENVTR